MRGSFRTLLRSLRKKADAKQATCLKRFIENRYGGVAPRVSTKTTCDQCGGRRFASCRHIFDDMDCGFVFS